MKKTRPLRMAAKVRFWLFFAAPHLLPAQNDHSFVTGKAEFAIKFKDEISAYKVMAAFVLPGERLSIEVVDGVEHDYDATNSHGTLGLVTRNKWRWRAPAEAGVYPVKISRANSEEAILLNVFVLIPYEKLKGETLNGYRIGRYPGIPLKQLSIYKPPGGFVEVTKENEEILVSPHFTLKQFLCKQASGYPKYLVLRERLLLKLEFILEQVNLRGHRCDTFFVMSGYRTPYYNKAIGNVKYSRHVWGGAADIFIDADPRDGMVDDLNKDGEIDHHDAAVIYDIIDEMYGESWYERFIGGLGRYRKTANHGPFVHVDVRGFRARWGK